MGGREGNRGYLIQALIALLDSLSSDAWETVTIEPDDHSEKVDIQWQGRGVSRAVQVKSSRNQITLPDAQRWADDLRKSSAADIHELRLIGPASQGVITVGEHGGVIIPCPKNLDLSSFENEAAHLLAKFLHRNGIAEHSSEFREMLVGNLVSRLIRFSTTGEPLTRSSLIAQIKTLVSIASPSVSSRWERITFDNQRTIESAIAGNRLGPQDVDACPRYSICEDIARELGRRHVYELAGTSGSGKSITAWHVAQQFEGMGYSIWRPSTSITPPELLADLPSGRSLLVVDDAHVHGSGFASRLSELASESLKVLLVSTVDNTQLSEVVCLPTEKCVGELVAALLERQSEILPIIQKFDSRVGDRMFDTPLDFRLQQVRKEKRPWDVFWFLRGGWNSAQADLDGLRQFDAALEVLWWIAVTQVLTCDAGITLRTLLVGLATIGVSEEAAESALLRLGQLKIILRDEVIRTKHLAFAQHLLRVSCSNSNKSDWPRIARVLATCATSAQWPLKGMVWLLDVSLTSSDAFISSKGRFRPILEPIWSRCLDDRNEQAWAAGTIGRLIDAFELPPEDILPIAEHWHRWALSGNATAAYFCAGILNSLINKSPRDEGGHCTEIPSEQLTNHVDAKRLANVVNCTPIEEIYGIARLLDRMSYSMPPWASEFVSDLAWDRFVSSLANASEEHSHAIDEFAWSIARLATTDNVIDLQYIDDIVPFIIRAINENPMSTVQDMHGVFWYALGFGPEFLFGRTAPDSRQRAIAERIVAGVLPDSIARAIEKAASRDLESLSHTLHFIEKIDSTFVSRVVRVLDTEAFFSATTLDWMQQTGELESLLRFFARGPTLAPASAWVRVNMHRIQGPLKPLFVAIAPDVAIEFYRAGRGIELLAQWGPRWPETVLAITALAKTNLEVCAEIVSKKQSVLLAALYHLNLDSERNLISLFRVLSEVSPLGLEEMLSQFDFDDPQCVKLLEQLRKNQPRERARYLRLARYGKRVGGKFAALSAELERRVSS